MLYSLLRADTAPPQGLIHGNTVSLELGSSFKENAPLLEDYWHLGGFKIRLVTIRIYNKQILYSITTVSINYNNHSTLDYITTKRK